jgi:hypothetical protein
MLPQPPPVTIASILLALLSLVNLVQGESVIFEENLTAADFLPIVVGVGGLVGARGLWMLKRWAMWLAIIVCVLDILMNAPELTFPFTAIYAAIYIVVCALVILLVVLPNSRCAYT